VGTGTAVALGILLLLLNGFFVAAEFALLAARRARLEQLAAEGDTRAIRAVRSLHELTTMLAGAQLGITICSLGLGAVAEPAVAHLLESAIGLVVDLPSGLLHALSFTFALSIVVFLHMVVGEMAPKSWAITHPEASALRLITPFRLFTTLLRPVLVGLNEAANLMVRMVGVSPREEVSLALSSAELRVLLQRSAAEGSIDVDTQELLTRSLQLSGLHAHDAMTPRREIVAVPAEASLDEVEDVARTSGRSRLVVHDRDLDHVVGVVLVRDVLVVEDVERARLKVRALVRDVVVAHEHQALEDLLVEMRTRRRQLAVVVDEYGLVTGLVTVQDVLDELVGEFDQPGGRTGRIRRQPDGTWLVDASIGPHDFSAVTGLTLPAGEWDSVAGFLITVLDRIPEVEDEVSVEGYRIHVTEMDGYAVSRVVVTPPDAQGWTRLRRPRLPR